MDGPQWVLLWGLGGGQAEEGGGGGVGLLGAGLVPGAQDVALHLEVG